MAKRTKFVYNADGVAFTIYRVEKPTKSGPKTYWLLEDTSTGKRRTLNNVSREAAERRADQIREAMVKGQAHRMLLSNGQWQDVCMAAEVLRSTQTGESLFTAIRSWAECEAMLNGKATLFDAVRFYLAHHRGNGPKPTRIRFDEAAKLYHAFKMADGKSASHCDNIQSRLNRLTKKLPAGVMLDELTAGQLEQAVVSLGLSPKTRNEYKITLGNLYTWAAKQNPPLVPKGFNPGKEMERYKVKHGDVEFLRVTELKQILATLPAKRPDLLPLVVLVCFAGLRPSEAARLDWRPGHWPTFPPKAALDGEKGHAETLCMNTDEKQFSLSRVASKSKSLSSVRNLFLVPTLIAGLMLAAGRVVAQTFTKLYSFTPTSVPNSPYTNSDGAVPRAELVLSGNTLYGTAERGGSSGNGTVFAFNTDGTGFTTLHSFTGSDGASPQAGLVLSGNTLYGTALNGGSSGYGTVFAVNTDGTGFTNLYSFTDLLGSPYPYTNSDGAAPRAVLVLSGNTLYGTAWYGGSSGPGTLFAVNTDGTGFTTLHSFTAGSGSSPYITNSDGGFPYAGLILSGDTLYGTTLYGGSSGNGTVFAVNIDGTGFTNLYNFTVTSRPYFYTRYTNSDGAHPKAVLVLSGNTLYGTAQSGGSSGVGTVFAVNTDGTGFTTLHSFNGSDGASPQAGLVLSGNTLYGTTFGGGSSGGQPIGAGTVFAVNTDGTGFTTLHRFFYGSDGDSPQAGLVLSGNTLYGTTGNGPGNVFSLSFAPQLTIIPSASNVILKWPTNFAGFDYTGFTLQSTTNLLSQAVWSTVSPGSVVVNGQNAVTNPVSGTQEFYRLSQ